LELEFEIKSTPNILYQRLTTSGGLSQWFADRVTEIGTVFTFYWDGEAQRARMVEDDEVDKVRFEWLGEEEGYFFEFEITEDDITGDIGLVVRDFVYADERDYTREIWETQIKQLKRGLGL